MTDKIRQKAAVLALSYSDILEALSLPADMRILRIEDAPLEVSQINLALILIEHPALPNVLGNGDLAQLSLQDVRDCLSGVEAGDKGLSVDEMPDGLNRG